LRTDYNVETVGDHVLDDLRMRMSVPTIELLREQGARIAICSHRGRPKGAADPELSNSHLAGHLSKLIDAPVETADDCIGDAVADQIRALPPGGVLLLENVRFYPEEEANDPEFAVALSQLADMYVDDAFGAVHRAHASIVGVPEHLPSAAGLLLERELSRLHHVEETPEDPLAIIVGGAKVADKLPLLEHLLPKAHIVCLGGAAANAVLQARGIDVGASRINGKTNSPEAQEAAQQLVATLEQRDDLDLVLPSDVVVERDGEDGSTTVAVEAIPADARVVDLGPNSIEAFKTALNSARTVLWNGPLGVFERPPLDRGTTAIAQHLASLDARVVVGGGETAAAVRQAGVADELWHVSTGGGAALHLLSGKSLPGVEALEAAAARIPSLRPAELTAGSQVH
jgi:phosphoglycerate kinase